MSYKKESYGGMFIYNGSQALGIEDNSSGQIRSRSASGFETILAGDCIWLSAANLTDGSEFTIKHCNVHISSI